ncbi:MAG TPA: chromosome segregation protein SMC, partial [Planctomycetota bacterium]|nr:chromosome segregation protein SMC [Planctomycetota bacterium]
GEVDWKGLQEEVGRLRNRLQSFGNVNMLALEKLQELEQRETFCKDQRRDLHKSKQELEEFIDKVNKESQEMFSKTIEIVRKHFNDIFRKVFGGGKADILVESDPAVDPLDQGVEVLTKLPKKEISKLSLMSGGEKSLTAIALTLALFKARPTAFCILDECDAALDESNVHRYAALIQEFSKETQFIVITHNKRTMMVADKLYGITMSPPGVTRRVSVNFEKAAQLVDESIKPKS